VRFIIGALIMVAGLNAFGMGRKSNRKGVYKNLCDVDLKVKTKRIIPEHQPNYFFKTSPDGRYIFYISEFKNYRLDTKTGIEIVLPGNVDPVPSPDGKILSSVNFQKTDKRAFSLNLTTMKDWDVQRLKNGDVDNSKVTTDERDYVTYQSVGQLGENNYRIISANAGTKKFQFRDYVLEGKNINSKEEAMNVIPLGDLRLPMISRTGDEFIALDTKKNESVIFKINDKDKSVSEVERLSFPTGKGDFSPDGKKITFHVTEQLNLKEKVTSEVNMPSLYDNNKEVRNVFVYDRETRTTTPITQNITGNSYFPVFLNDGRVIYMDQGSGQRLSFVISEIPDIAPRSISRAKDCYNGKSFDKAFRKLSEHWVEACQGWEGNNPGAKEVMALNISSELCHQIAQDSGDENIVKVCEALTKSELSKPKIVKESKKPVQKLLQVKCAICHQGNIPFKDPDKLKSHKKSILKRIHSKDPKFSMPLGGSLTKNEKREVTEYLESL
jgi:hypothetical protein